jgi:ABC-type branched-subunit amino acid transport system ATPase component
MRRDEDGPLLEATGLRKHFGGVRAVDDVSLVIRQRETVGIIGPNGAGKTTLFELVSGFSSLDTGRVIFAGQDVTRLPPENRGRLGLIRSFQDASLFDTLTVIETVALALERELPTRFLPTVLGWHRAEARKLERARELVSLMGLDAYRDARISELSTGTRRITEITCLLALNPTLLLLDEPSCGVAQRETEALGALLRSMKSELDTTFVIIEHDMPLVMGISDRIVAMESGRIIAEGTPEAVRNDPLVIESYLGADAAAIERSGRLETAGSKE